MNGKQTDDETEQDRLCEKAANPCIICGKITLNEGVCYREECQRKAALWDEDWPEETVTEADRERLRNG